MTVLYEVKTGHTKKVLKAFADFYNEKRANGKKLMFRYLIIAALFFTIPRSFKLPDYGNQICWGAGIVILILAFTKNYITYFHLLYHDIYYKYGIKISMSFGHSSFTIEDSEKKTYKYQLIKKLYANKEMLFLLMENDDLFIIPKEDFTAGTPEDFYNFMQQTTGKEFGAVSLTFKQKLFRLKMKAANMGTEDILSEEKRK